MTPSTSSTTLQPQLSQPQLRKPPSPPSRRQTPRIRQTLRKPDEEAETAAKDGSNKPKHKHRHGKKIFGVGGNSNKHSHHEGQRRRWREEITPREKKRYEGVWASNRGRLMDLDPNRDPDQDLDTQDSEADVNLVSGVVIRDIWARSRLPVDELAEVWDLVIDHRTRVASAGAGAGAGTSGADETQATSIQRGGRAPPKPGTRPRDRALNRTEFVVGMWLIDQRLRGRKIPPKISDSVWGSARGGGVSVKRPKGAKK